LIEQCLGSAVERSCLVFHPVQQDVLTLPPGFPYLKTYTLFTELVPVACNIFLECYLMEEMAVVLFGFSFRESGNIVGSHIPAL
jgi:hypothetical protein